MIYQSLSYGFVNFSTLSTLTLLVAVLVISIDLCLNIVFYCNIDLYLMMEQKFPMGLISGEVESNSVNLMVFEFFIFLARWAIVSFENVKEHCLDTLFSFKTSWS